MGEIGRFFSWEIIDEITAIKNCDKSFLSIEVQEYQRK